MRMYVTFISLSTIVYLLTIMSFLEAHNTTFLEPARSESLGFVHTRMRDSHIQHSNVMNYLASAKRRIPVFINGSVGLASNRVLQFLNNMTNGGNLTPVRKEHSASSMSDSMSNYRVKSYTTTISQPKLVSREKRANLRKHVQKRVAPANDYTSTSDENSGRMKNISNVSEDDHHYGGGTHAKELGGNNILKYKTEALLTSSTAKADSYVLGKRVNKLVSKCTCDDTTCDFSHCNLTSVPQVLTPNITVMLLSYNKINYLPINGFSRYTFLEMLDLSYNDISIVEVGAFNGLSRLMSLDLTANSLGTNEDISDRIFEPLKSLKVIRLYLNNFPCANSPPFQDRFLAYLHNLEELYTDNYGNEEFGPGFKNMTSLRNLTFDCLCSFGRLSNTTFINLQQITLLDISACNIHGHNIDVDAFSPLRNLISLNISDNKVIGMDYLPVILRGLNNSNLRVLTMDRIVSDDSINFINSSITLHLPRTLAVLSARQNNIISLDGYAFLDLPSSLRFVDLSDNFLRMQAIYFPLEILSELEVLLVNTDLTECLSNDPKISDPPSGGESGIHQLQRHNNRQIKELKEAAKVSMLKIPGKLKRIQINVRGMHESFLFNVDSNNSLEEIDLRCSVLSDFNFIDMVNFPKLRYLNLGRSSIQKFSFSAEYEIPPIKVLIMESNRLNDFLETSEIPFRSFNNLSHLDLSLNQISSLNHDLFKGLDTLEYLRLDGNTFSFFGANISHMEHLKLLNVSNTGLSYLPSQVRSHVDHLCQARPTRITVDMSGCPIQCDCFNLDFLKWMVKSSAFDTNFTGYICRYPDASFKYMRDGYKETILKLDRECAKNYPMFLAILLATLILLSAVTGIIIYRFRWKIRYLYYAAYLKVMDANRIEDHEFKYDVFIAYDSEDQRFVERYFGPELENRGLKLLIHTRDFVAGTYIASNIVMAVAESRKTLVVLTRNLLESSWCNYEIQMATMEAVHTGRQVLMFLLKEDIPNRELDVELLRYIKTNTYLPYPGPEDEGDEEVMKSFYDKLAHDLKC